METTTASRRPVARAFLLGALACLAVALAGCGDDDRYTNRDRPAAPINVTASIGDSTVSISPDEFGAGPVVLIITNQSDKSQDVTLETDELAGTSGGITQSTGPINPQDSAQLQADLRQGTYSISTDLSGVSDAKITVGPARPSAQDELLLP
ncbi:MAG TPA: hypothetical protein VK279_09560 [Solirubrobacteraceae bacterium]|nr:hypothetical protein [Solirubrobacteraceae bacterium]